MQNKFVMISAAAILAIGSTSAFAQSQPSGQSGTTSSSPSSASSASSTLGSVPKAMSQDKVRQVMKDAGFSNVQILDATYLVRAQTKDGDHILVVLNPPVMGNAPATTGSTSSGATGSSTGGTSGSSTGTAQPAQKP